MDPFLRLDPFRRFTQSDGGPVGQFTGCASRVGFGVGTCSFSVHVVEFAIYGGLCIVYDVEVGRSDCGVAVAVRR